MDVMPSSMFSVLVESRGLQGTLSNLEIKESGEERDDMIGLYHYFVYELEYWPCRCPERR